jgi:glycosyltransferase involved in cell wall biosynthesis
VLRALSSYTEQHEFILLFNARLSGTLDEALSEVPRLLPKARPIVFEVPAPTAGYDPANDKRRELAELIREHFIAELRPDVVHVFSLFEGFVDNVVTSIGRLPVSYPVSSTFFDLIPLLNPEEYLDDNPQFRSYYLGRLDQMTQSQRLLAISAFSATEAAENLQYPLASIVEAPLGPMQEHALDNLSGEEEARHLKAMNLEPGFVLYVGGSDRRKNLPRLVEAWSQLPANLQAAHPLVMAGSMPEGDIVYLNALAQQATHPGQFNLLGQVSDAQLRSLYRGCRVFVFPSWHEGFGLPALEAMVEGVAVIAANTSSLPEVVGLDEALFNPFDVDDITVHLQRALTDKVFRESLITHGLEHSRLFSWPRTASATMACWEAMQDEGAQQLSEETLPSSWHDWVGGYKRRLDDFLDLIAERLQKDSKGSAKFKKNPDNDGLLLDVARVLEINERTVYSTVSSEYPSTTPWRIEGPFDSSYSLALVNREFAHGLVSCGIEVALHSKEGSGDFEPDAKFLEQHPEVATLHSKAAEIPPAQAAVLSRNLFPPSVTNMAGRVNALHCWAWEESALPREWVADFNAHLTGMTVTSNFVRKALLDNGVRIPVEVTGNGVDHWQRVQPDDAYQVPEVLKQFVYLHVSSCFPRKGIDSLIEAYGQAFTNDDEVSLLIKTFSNPHNRVHELLASARLKYANYPHVVVVEADLSKEQLKALMRSGDALVAPSRGEGFGLPLAEAMMMGIPVITTAYGGQMDFCSEETAWCVDFEFARAYTHFALPNSVWAEPRVASLVEQLVAVKSATPEARLAKCAAAQALLMEKYTWQKVAARASDAVLRWQADRNNARINQPARRLAWVSTWGTRCGIARYSENLLVHCSWPLRVFAPDLSHGAEVPVEAEASGGVDCLRCWRDDGADDLVRLAAGIEGFAPTAVVIQFNYGFFDFSALAALIEQQKAQGRVVVVMLHATEDPPQMPERQLGLLVPALSLCDRLLVHGVADLNNLKRLGLISNTAIVPHGILDWAPAQDRRANALMPATSKQMSSGVISDIPSQQSEGPSGDDPASALAATEVNQRLVRQQTSSSTGAAGTDDDSSAGLLIASFGFFLPHKGLSELVEAISILKQQGLACRLLMLNAQYPVEVSDRAIAGVREQIEELGLEDVITVDTGFYSDQRCLELLSAVDLVVFPYQKTAESSSAAVRHALASGSPVALTPLSIFQDVFAAGYMLPGCTPRELADGISHWIKAHEERLGNTEQTLVGVAGAESAVRVTDCDTADTALGFQHELRRPSQAWLEEHAHQNIMRNIEGLIGQLSC